VSGVLAGLQIVNTRAVHQAAELDSALSAAGAIPISYPCIALVPPSDPIPFDRALERLRDNGFDWIVFTSANAVSALAALPPTIKIAAIGHSTANEIRERLGRSADYVAETATSATLASALPALPGDRVLLPQSEIADRVMEAHLATRGVEVTAVSAYRTVVGSGGVDLKEKLKRREIDALTLCSPSAVRGLLARLGDGSDCRQLPTACIGPTTGAAAREAGFSRVIQASEATVSGLVNALEIAFQESAKGASAWRSS
jgi:uroporphyrinogen-III synthase